jgi:hypothetical protein
VYETFLLPLFWGLVSRYLKFYLEEGRRWSLGLWVSSKLYLTNFFYAGGILKDKYKYTIIIFPLNN